MYRIFVVEDDPGIAQGIFDLVVLWGMEAVLAQDFREITKEFQEAAPQLVLMDITLPFYNGYHWCQEIRKLSRVPIIFLSSASDNMNIVMAMSMGGDDFVAKPFDSGVLMAKLMAMLRRTYDFSTAVTVLSHREAFLNTGENSLSYHGEKIPLTKNEYRILFCLMENKGKVVSREKLMEKLWETDAFVDENALTVNVGRLRKKLEAAGLESFITTKFGVGYVIETS